MTSNRPSPRTGLPRPLADRIRGRIETEGPLTFRDFMEAALYDEDGGFYSRAAVGEAGDFVTSPHVSSAFGVLVAAQVEEFWQLLGEPDPFSVVEVGAGDGTLARQVLESLSAAVSEVTRYTAVDRSAAARESLARLGVEVAADIYQVQGSATGCVVANELLDNIPFHRLRRTANGIAELYVGSTGGRFTLQEGPLSRPELADHVPDLPAAAEWAARPEAKALLDETGRILSRGYVWVADYALGESSPASVHGYRRHRLEEDVLDDPGSRDITAGVDFAQLARHARDRGFPVWGPVTQRQALLALGFRELERRARARQVEAVRGGRGIDALRIYSNRTRANLLLARGGLGDFSVLCVGVGVDRSPRSFLSG